MLLGRARPAPTAIGDRSTVRRADRSPGLLLEPPAPGFVEYDVLLLAGVARRLVHHLPPGIEAGAQVEIDGEQWTVADVRETDDGAPTTLVCIYAV
jgi:hypothetical protein